MKTTRNEPTLPYLSGLDGLRAVSVLAVMLYHAEVPWLQGGFLALDVFFVVSGYLITSLLRAEVERTGHIDLWAFWKRRARRLLPALFALIAVVVAVTAVHLPAELWALKKDVAAGLTYCTNWYLILAHQSYFEQLERPSLLRHLWSLAIEEQFYVLWPLVFGLALVPLPRRVAAWGLGILSLLSAAWMAWLFVPDQDPSRVYYGSDTRAQALLLGAALAFLLPPQRLTAGAPGTRAVLADVLGLAGLVTLAVACVLINDGDPFPYRGGFFLVDACALAMIVGAVVPGARVCGALFGSAPLRWTGRRSYGLYLWHWPVFMLTRPMLDVEMDGPFLLLGRLGVSFAIAEVSFRYLEEPIRQGALPRMVANLRGDAGPAWRLRARLWALSLVTGVCVLAASLWSAVRPVAGAEAWGFEGEEVRLVQVSEPNAIQRAKGSVAVDAAASSVPVTENAPPPSRRETKRIAPAPVRAHDDPTDKPVRTAVLCIGDSVMLGASRALRAALVNVEIDARVGRRAPEAARELAERREAGLLSDTVIIHIGNNGWLTAEDFEGMARALEGVPRVFFVTNHVARRWQDPNNQVILQGTQRYAGRFKAVNWLDASEGKKEWFRRDGCHLNNAGAAAYATLVSESALR